MQVLFDHLIKREETDDKGRKTGTRSFEIARAERLHWIKHHIEEGKCPSIQIFSFTDRIDGKDRVRTYIYDQEHEYVVILEPQRTGNDYYLITAYHLNEPGGKSRIEKKLKKKLDQLH